MEERRGTLRVDGSRNGLTSLRVNVLGTGVDAWLGGGFLAAHSARRRDSDRSSVFQPPVQCGKMRSFAGVTDAARTAARRPQSFGSIAARITPAP